VITPIQRILIFGVAPFAHGELLHGCFCTIIGYVLDDGETGAAIGAVGEGIAMASVRGVHDLLQTGTTGADIGGNGGEASFTLHTSRDDKILITASVHKIDVASMDLGKNGWLLQNTLEKLPDGSLRAIDLNMHTAVGVFHESLEVERECTTIHEGAETHTLNDTLESNIRTYSTVHLGKPLKYPIEELFKSVSIDS
jgi:hypothetical protein